MTPRNLDAEKAKTKGGDSISAIAGSRPQPPPGRALGAVRVHVHAGFPAAGAGTCKVSALTRGAVAPHTYTFGRAETLRFRFTVYCCEPTLITNAFG